MAYRKEAPNIKRYWLFAWECYEQGGGFNDFIDTFDSVAEAVAKGNDLVNNKPVNTVIDVDSFEVIDSWTLQKVHDG